MITRPRIAITGGTGFVGRHLAERLGPEASVVISPIMAGMIYGRGDHLIDHLSGDRDRESLTREVRSGFGS